MIHETDLTEHSNYQGYCECDFCGSIEYVMYSTDNEIFTCETCYCRIPDHIPLSQDSVYVKELYRKKNE